MTLFLRKIKQLSLINKVKRKGLYSPITILLFFLSIAIITFVVCNKTAITAVFAQSNNPNKPLLPILTKHFKSVCDIPSARHAKCFAKVITDVNSQPVASSSPSVNALTPLQLHTAYNLPCTPNGQVQSPCDTPSSFGPIVAIVDAYHTPSIENDLNTYSNYYGLPSCTEANGCLQVVDQNGGTNLPTTTDANWSLEASLDVQTAHAMCQTCKILLVETNSNNMTDLATGVTTAVGMGAYAVSNSYGSGEWSSEMDLDSSYSHTGTAIVASSGDSGYGTSYPAANPNVIAVGGTSLQLYSDGTYNLESIWSGSGSGCSSYETANLFQQYLPNWSSTYCGSHRAITDISADANPYTGVAIFDTTPYNGETGWYQVGGTSLSSPIITSAFGLSPRIDSSLTGTDVIYSNNSSTNFHTVTYGSNGSCHTIMCNGTTIYDGPSGLGSINGLNSLSTLTASSSPSPVPTIAPVPAPTNLTATALSSSQIQLQWDAIQGISDYFVFRDGTEIAEGNVLSYTSSNLTPNMTYSYNVQARDYYGDLSPFSNTVSATTFPDVTSTPTPTPTTTPTNTPTPSPTPTNTPTPTPTSTPTPTPTPLPPSAPVVTIAGCISGPVSNTNTVSINWSDSSINWVNIGADANNNTYYDKYVLGSLSTQAPSGFTGASGDVLGQAMSLYPNKQYFATVWNGTQLSSATAFTVPSCPPDVSISNPKNGATLSKNSTIQISATVNDYASISSVKFYVNNVLQCTDATAPYSCGWNDGKKSNVSYTINVVATDALGNTGNNSVSVLVR